VLCKDPDGYGPGKELAQVLDARVNVASDIVGVVGLHVAAVWFDGKDAILKARAKRSS